MNEAACTALGGLDRNMSRAPASDEPLERRLAEQDAMLDNDLIGILRLQGRRILWTNRAFDRVFGYAPGELVGRDTGCLYPDVQAFQAFGLAAYPVLAAGGTYRCQLQLQRKDGRSVWVDCSGIRPCAQEPEVSIWYSLDVTSEREAQALRLQAAELEAENRQLQATQHLQGRFLAHMSHELRTPLNAVIGFAELLARGAVPAGSERQNAYLERIAASGRHLLQLIETLLDTARAESGQLRLQAEPTDAQEAAADALRLVTGPAHERQVQLELQLQPGLPALLLDPLRLRQVLLHYLGNAIKFSHPGGRVVLRLRRDGDDALLIEVEDRGIGIAAAELPQLFSKFRQLSSGPTRAYEGAGAGLALVRLIVEAQGGEVGVRSEPGRGSVFSARLPGVLPPPATA